MKEDTRFATPTLIGPGAFYVTGEDNLRVVIRNSLSAAVVTIEGRFLSLAGDVTPFVQTIAPAADRSAVTTDFRLGDGWILNVSARVTSGDPQVGQVYVRLLVIRGLGPAPINIGTLAQGYATNTDDLAWPGAPIRSSVEGPGWIREVAIAPAPDEAEFTVTQPASTRWRVISLRTSFTTLAQVANRETTLLVTGPSGILGRFPTGVTQTASQVRTITWFQGGARGAGSVALHIIATIPYLVTLAGTVFSSETANITTDDAYAGGGTLLVEEWIEA